MRIVDAVGHALTVAGGMTWQILWSLVLGFALSAIVQALVRKSTIERMLGETRPRRSESRPAWVSPARRVPTRRWRWPEVFSGRGPTSPQ